VRKRLIVDAERCTGCNSCILECSFVHNKSFSWANSRIQVEKEPERAISTPKVCLQCAEAPCITACSVGALSQDKTSGGIRLDEKRCIGCKACVSACPYEGVFFDEERGIPLICDLCGGEPACVAVCQLPQAIQVVER